MRQRPGKRGRFASQRENISVEKLESRGKVRVLQVDAEGDTKAQAKAVKTVKRDVLG